MTPGDLQEEIADLEAQVVALTNALNAKAFPMAEDPVPAEDRFIVIQQQAQPPQPVVMMLGGDTYIEETYMLR